MSIHDVSKHDDARLDPKANASDARAQRDAHGTNSVNYVTDATNTTHIGGILAGNARLVFKATATVTISAANTIGTASFAHNLGYVPNTLAAVEGADVTSASGTVSGASINLPNFVAANINTGTGIIEINAFAYAYADSSRVYINLLSALGVDAQLTVTVYLYQQTAASS